MLMEFWLRIYANMCEFLETQIPFDLRLFVLDDGSVRLGSDKHVNNWVQTSIMIGRHWRAEGMPSLKEWNADMARVAAFEMMSHKQFGRLEVYLKKSGKYVTFLKGA